MQKSYHATRPSRSAPSRFSGNRQNNSYRRQGSGGGGGRRKPAYIDINKFINKAATAEETTVYNATHSFADFGFVEQLQTNLTNNKYVTPTAIQDQAIKPAMEGRDIVGLANTGTGKTAAFVLPIIHRLSKNPGRNTVLVITPTRELAHQVEGEFKLFSTGMRLYSAVCVGGESLPRQRAQLGRGVHVVVGTPGRLKDLLQQRVLQLDNIKTLVLDEADQMLDMGFLPDIRFLLSHLPEKRQIMCFSATMNDGVKSLLAGLLSDPVILSLRTRETAEHIAQDVVYVQNKDDKFAKLKELIADPQYERILVFGEMKFGVQRLADALNQDGFSAEAIHGNKSQSQRLRALRSFAQNRVQILCATDVAARGLDIPDVNLVINFDRPNDYQTYVHRIGRTGRAGKAGMALTFV